MATARLTADDGVGAQPGLVRRAVQVDHRLVDQPLVVGVVAEQFRLDLVDDGLDGLGDALAAVGVAAVAELDRLERAGGGAARRGRPAVRAVVEHDLDLDRGVAPGVQDLPGVDGVDGGQGGLLACRRFCGAGIGA